MVVFASLKLQIMLARDDSVTTVTRSDGNYSPEDRFSLSDGEFAMAFGIQKWRGKSNLDDPRFIKWVLHYAVEVNHVRTTKWYPLHKCEERDFQAFY